MAIPLHEPQITNFDIETVTDALRSQWVSTGGPYIDRFERELADFIGFKHAVAVCNGTAGLVLALEILRRKKGFDNGFCVLVPTLSFAATWNCVIQAGGIPVPVDTAPDSVNICASTVQKALNRYFKQENGLYLHKETNKPLLCAIPAHVLGWSSDLDAIAKLCNDLNLDLVEDAAESLGTYYNSGGHVGAHGACAVLSFNGNKILTTGGGGMVITNNPEFAKRAKHLSTTAKTNNLRFFHDEAGYNFRMVNILAALGVAQLSRLSDNLARKSEISRHISERLIGSNVALYKQDNCRANNWINTVRFPSNSLREVALNKLQASGFDCRPLWTPFHHLPYCSVRPSTGMDFTNSEAMWTTLLSLPSSPQLAMETVDRICDILLST